jgi:hypothetical protein
MEEALGRCMAALDGVRQQLVKEQMLQAADSPVPPALLVLPPSGGTGTGKPAASAPEAAPPLWLLGAASFGRKLGYWGLRQEAGLSFFDVSREGPLLAIQCLVLMRKVEQQLQPAAGVWAGLPEERRQALRAMADGLDEQISWLDRARKAVPQPTAQQWAAWHAKHPEGILRGAPHAPALARLMLEAILPQLQQQGQQQLLHDSLEAARELGAARLSTQQAERLQWLRALVSSEREFAALLRELAAAQAEPDSDTCGRQQQQIAGNAIDLWTQPTTSCSTMCGRRSQQPAAARWAGRLTPSASRMASIPSKRRAASMAGRSPVPQVCLAALCPAAAVRLAGHCYVPWRSAQPIQAHPLAPSHPHRPSHLLCMHCYRGGGDWQAGAVPEEQRWACPALRCAVLRCAVLPYNLPLCPNPAPVSPPGCAADKDCRLCFYLENVSRQAAKQQLVTGKQPCTGRCKALTKRQKSRMYRAGGKGDFSFSSYESYQQAGPMRPPTSGGRPRLTPQQRAERQAVKEERTRLGNQYLEEKRQREEAAEEATAATAAAAAAAVAAPQPGRGSSSGAGGSGGSAGKRGAPADGLPPPAPKGGRAPGPGA